MSFFVIFYQPKEVLFILRHREYNKQTDKTVPVTMRICYSYRIYKDLKIINQGEHTMYQIDFHKPLHIHFIGIGGISMSGLAEILLGEDFVISGSDSKSSPLTQALEKKGATIYYGQRATNITDDVDVVVYTAAIHPDNPEFACALK